jgi:hypothetical protein
MIKNDLELLRPLTNFYPQKREEKKRRRKKRKI